MSAGSASYLIYRHHPGLSAVDVSGNYAYVANLSDNNQLQIINISQMDSPMLVSSYDFEGAEYGISVFFLDNKVYVGTEKSKEGEEFHIVDVSDPDVPILLGELEIGDDVNA
ncbi:unnamed protein product, partial [marine sediment metagenome]